LADIDRNQVIGGVLARRVRLALGAGLVTVVLAACGGGGDSPAAGGASPSASPSAGVGQAGSVASEPAASGGAAVVPDGSEVTGGRNAAAGDSAAGDSVASDAIPVASAPGATTLSWIPPTMTEDGKPLMLTGYRIYWGPTEDYFPYSVTLKNPGLTRHVVEQLAPATWFFVATALSETGESAFSNVIAMRVL
jgi:hypothetical protein